METVIKITKITINILVGIVGIIAIVLLVGSFGIIPQFKTYVVSSGSMEPALKTGSIVLVGKSPSYNFDDIVSFKNSDNKDDVVTHRIVSRIYSNDLLSSPTYHTKGDANSNIDQGKVNEEQIVGKVFFSLPFLGYFTEFVKKPYGFILFVVIPATIIIYEELKTLKKELRAWFLKMRQKNQEEKEILDKTGINKMFFVVPILAAAIAISSFSISFFSDNERSLANTMVAGVWVTPTPSSAPTIIPTPTPISNHLVINEVFYFVDNDHKIGNSESGSEWVELYNPTFNTISLTSWSIKDNTSCDNLPSVSIPALGFAIVSSHTEAEFKAVWSVPTGVIFVQSPTAIGNGLANNDELMLKDGLCSSTNIVDYISWGSNTDGLNPSIPVTVRGFSSERSPDGVDTDTKNDFVDRNPPTPGS